MLYISKCLNGLLPLIFLTACNWNADSSEKDDGMVKHNQPAALTVVAKRIDGFNSHNIDAYLAAHDEDVQIYEYPDKKIGSGRSHLRKIFGPLLKQGIGEIKVEHQVAINNTVISEEFSNYGGQGFQHIVAIYEIERGLITSIRLVESRG